MKRLLKEVLARTPYRIVRRTGLNRFQAIDEAIESLARRGFEPAIVIDGGANVGAFSRFSLCLFPKAIVHAIEPQKSCVPALELLRVSAVSRLFVHQVALCAPEDDGCELRIAADVDIISTGAHVTVDPNGLTVCCVTLDTLFQGQLGPRAFLKLDLQGYELEALRGAVSLLSVTEVVLVEASYYAQAYEPPISRLVAFLAEHEFELYDIASIYARPRDDRPRQSDLIFVKAGSPLSLDKKWS